MEYTIKTIAELSNISTRTLRYYDELGLLKPKKINDSGYRIYGTNEVDRLQKILFLRSLGIRLEEITFLMNQPSLVIEKSLLNQRDELLRKRKDIDQLITNVETTLGLYKESFQMTDQGKLEKMKNLQLQENKMAYEEEAIQLYGKDQVLASYQKFAEMSSESYAEFLDKQNELNKELKVFLKVPDLNSNTAKRIFEIHKKILSSVMTLSREIHICIANLYESNIPFQRYYDDAVEKNAAKVLADIIKYHEK